jgi:hypothetical protein
MVAGPLPRPHARIFGAAIDFRVAFPAAVALSRSQEQLGKTTRAHNTQPGAWQIAYDFGISIKN